jgi:hypothetical protein
MTDSLNIPDDISCVNILALDKYVRDVNCKVRLCYLSNGHDGEHANAYMRWKG